MRRGLIAAALAAAGVLAVPAAASAASLQGVVVQKSAHARTIAVAGANGRVLVAHVRTARSARLGAKVTLAGHMRSDGTFAASSMRTIGRSHQARVSGIVARRGHRGFLLSAGGTMLAVQSHETHSVGQPLTTTVTVSQEGLDEDDQAQTTSRVEVSGVVGALTPATATTPGSLTITIGNQSIVFAVPAGSDLGTLAVGDFVEAKGEVVAGVLTLTDIGNQEGDDQGDDNNNQGGDDGGGGGQGGDD